MTVDLFQNEMMGDDGSYYGLREALDENETRNLDSLGRPKHFKH